ncbi:MAG: GntR family transcriptional regulator [Verrucomicrobiae bacterium]|nr:GntR family transcriptional regulator [Verrucomicrobiae bacterium]
MSRNQSEIAYEYLRRKIFNRELIAGSKVRYGPLGKEIGMSATPIREAIGRLASEGLVELVPQSGAIVKRPTREDAAEVYEMREAIEPFAAAKACQLIGVRQLKTLEGTLVTMQEVHAKATTGELVGRSGAAVFDEADLRFHLTILEAADNRRMLKVVGDFHLLTGIIGADRHDYDADVLEMTIDDHGAILGALRERDPEKVRRAMVTHIRNSRQLTLSLLGGQHRPPVFPLPN